MPRCPALSRIPLSRWTPLSFHEKQQYAIRRKAGGAPAWLYVLLEHQSTPDVWLRLRLRLLKYSIRIWERDRRRHPKEEQLR